MAANSSGQATRRILREPLLHFVVLGGIVFGLQAAVSRATSDREIVVTGAVRAELAEQFRKRSGHAPSADELGAEVARWARDEAAYREALRLGLDRDDPALRSRLVAKLFDVQERLVSERTPSDGDLAKLLAANPNLYASPLRVDVSVMPAEVGTDAGMRARELAERLNTGAVAESDAGPRPQRLEHRGIESLRRSFGAGFAAGIETASLGRWLALESADGWRVARIERREGGGAPTVDSVRARLVRDWQLGTRRREAEARMAEIAKGYRVVEQPE